MLQRLQLNRKFVIGGEEAESGLSIYVNPSPLILLEFVSETSFLRLDLTTLDVFLTSTTKNT